MNIRTFCKNDLNWMDILVLAFGIFGAVSLICGVHASVAAKAKLQEAESLDNVVRQLYVEHGLYTEEEKQERMKKAMTTIMDRDAEIYDLKLEMDKMRVRIAELEDQNLKLRIQVAPVKHD